MSLVTVANVGLDSNFVGRGSPRAQLYKYKIKDILKYKKK